MKVKQLPYKLTMKLGWIFLDLSRRRFRKKSHFWIFIGLMTLLSIGVLQIISGHGTRTRFQAFEQSDTFPYETGETMYGNGDINLHLDIDRMHSDRLESHSSEEIQLNDHSIKLESQSKHMGISRKTLSKAGQKSRKTNSKDFLAKSLIDVLEVSNLNEGPLEDNSLEEGGYMSVNSLELQPSKTVKLPQIEEQDSDNGVRGENKQPIEGHGQIDIPGSKVKHTNSNTRSQMNFSSNSVINTDPYRSHDTHNKYLGSQIDLDQGRNLEHTNQSEIHRSDQMPKTNASTEGFTAIQRCNALRMKRIKTRCQDLDYPILENLTDTELKSFVSKIITDDKHNVLMHAVPKTGTSSWKMVMLNNSGLVISQGKLPPGNSINDWLLLKSYGLRDLRSYRPVAIRRKLQSYYTILTVRHPFERLESTFREKFRNSRNKLYTKTVAMKIIEKYRGVNFTAGWNDSTLSNATSGSMEVTFEEFLRYSLSPENRDRHWNTYWEIANPCMFPYQYIAKTETADLDMDYIASTKLSSGQSRGSFKYNPSRNRTDNSRQDHGNTLEFFSQLNPEVQKPLVLATLDKYMNDMELFGYKIYKEGNKIISACHTYSEEGICC